MSEENSNAADDREITVVEDQVVHVDYLDLKDVHFVRCRIIYKGGLPPTTDNVKFTECAWSFDMAARNTIDLLRILVQGGDDARNIVVHEMLGIPQ